jgi:hypothetical protein
MYFMGHRIREALRQSGLAPPLMGGGHSKIVEADETFIGRKRDVPSWMRMASDSSGITSRGSVCHTGSAGRPTWRTSAALGSAFLHGRPGSVHGRAFLLWSDWLVYATRCYAQRKIGRAHMATVRTLPMQIIELRADGWVTAADFLSGLKQAIGAPDWHGDSADAFVDSMIHHDDINALKPPYTIRISGADKAKPEARHAIHRMAGFINEAGATDRGGDLEVTIVVEDAG